MNCLGIDIGGSYIYTVIMDENGRILGRGKLMLNAPRSVDEITEDMAFASRVAMCEAGLIAFNVSKGRRVLDIPVGCVAVRGELDIENGVVIHSPDIGFKDAPLVRIISRKTGVKCSLCQYEEAAARGGAADDTEYSAGAGAALIKIESEAAKQ